MASFAASATMCGIYLLVMPKYWGKQIFSLIKRRKKKEERLKVGNNNGQLRIANATSGGACKPPRPITLPFTDCPMNSDIP